ncbi:MAG: hypothetical protein EOQ82_32165 [Mesorhizobium sp.]|uniref:hypothetical protein n=1 Tax=Mesorhizobium sp. TaxID=1871066 RepID=UPI000FE5C73B|nr:hypothetical protein [Mesorhizobium sp.]RWH49661.1 MAG: hypothetical protein EOQ82_32165 [Mesorhizobium sp.]
MLSELSMLSTLTPLAQRHRHSPVANTKFKSTPSAGNPLKKSGNCACFSDILRVSVNPGHPFR